MNLHEYQAKVLFARFGIPVPRGQVAADLAEVEQAAAALGDGPWVLKAQIHAGGRGKAGGVLTCSDRPALQQAAAGLLGRRLVTAQSGPDGLPVQRLLVEQTTAIARELYLGLLVDRAARRVVIVAATAGGMEIEDFAVAHPEDVLVTQVQPAVGLQPWHGRRLGFFLGLAPAQMPALQALLAGLYRLFIDCDASLVEVNPLVVTTAGDLLAVDAKINLDDNALVRHPDLAALRDPTQEDPREAAARALALNYISLDGDIGCMVNGAGLAMATMDLIKLHGGAPANFLDVGGSASAERVAEAFKLVLTEGKVRAVLVNIFGGIVRCDLIAEGILGAVREIAVGVPVVVRLQGTNAAAGLALLAQSGLAIETATGLDEAADKVVAAAARQEGQR
ncbi:MAG: ADP-forming succinate--CoA ligase subunit beta [Chromatiaceae bacterium]|nr:MAG: ADP-forming succinate--CoA ligase subunit beta [Chromatiaceae bacterium]